MSDVAIGVTALQQDECWALLRTASIGRLAVVVDGRPDIFPVNFVTDHGTVVFRTGVGTKLDAVARRDVVAFEADGLAGDAWSVVIKGHAEEVRRVDELFDAAALPLFTWHSAPGQHYARITPDEISGRRFPIAERPAG